MTVTANLDKLRASVPGCSLAAYGDMTSQLVLRARADNAWPQEKLDELCRVAARQFDLGRSLKPGDGQKGGLREAIVATPRDIRVFVAAAEPAADMLCCVCRGDVPTEQVIDQARSALSDLMDQDQ